MDGHNWANVFLAAALVPRHGSHADGSLDRAESLRAVRPPETESDVFIAAVLGDAQAIRGRLESDPSLASAIGGPYQWDLLTHVCFSRYLRLDPERSAGLVAVAEALLDAGANANTGFWEHAHLGESMFETVMYGAAGVARHADMTRLLLSRGADPNDDETPYHAPETYDNTTVRVLVESGALTADSMAIMLLRKADWHDVRGVRYLLEHGADPNRMTQWGFTALHQALRRDNVLENVVCMLDYGGDLLRADGHAGDDALSLAARRGRGDVLAEWARRSGTGPSRAIDQLIAACAQDMEQEIGRLVAADPALADVLRRLGGPLLSQFAGNDNARGMDRLLDLGVPVDAAYAGGDAYFGIPAGSRALHVAAWRGSHRAVAALLARGADPHTPDPSGRTPVQLAVRACVDSHWSYRRQTDSVQALRLAGASVAAISLPTGYDALDQLLFG